MYGTDYLALRSAQAIPALIRHFESNNQTLTMVHGCELPDFEQMTQRPGLA